MKKLIFIITVIYLILSQYYTVISAEYMVNSVNSFNAAIVSASQGDTIKWENGTYKDIYLLINKNGITVLAESSGKVVFNGKSRSVLNGDQITFSGFQYLNGDIGENHVLISNGSENHISQVNIKDYNCAKYLIINAQCSRNEVSHCNFEHRMNTWDKNILSILVNATSPGYHTIRYCSFKNFDGTGGDMGVEPIRIGLSTQGDFISRSVVEYCYFTQCNGDGEIISNKSRQNVYRFNTFENNPKAELVLRHGDEGVVYSNFFLDGMGGVRIKEGQHHVVFNNYFAGIKKYPLNLQNYSVDPLDSITIAYNTIVNCQNISLGKSGSFPPKHVTFANNIFYNNQSEKLFTDRTGTENWIGNISFGDLGFAQPEGISITDPLLFLNQNGFYELAEGSPAIDAAQPDYPDLPNYPHLGIDYEVLFDLMGNERPKDIALKDVGCFEFSGDTLIKPYATAENTGPNYLHSVDTFLSKRPKVTGSSKIVNNIDDVVEATSNMEGFIYLVKYGLDVTSEAELDSLVQANLGRKVEILVSDSTVQIYTRGLPGDYYQFYALNTEGYVSLPSSNWVIVEQTGPVTQIYKEEKGIPLGLYFGNGKLVVSPQSNDNYSLEIYNIDGKLLLIKNNLSGKQNFNLSGIISGLLIVRKRSNADIQTIKVRV